MDNCIVCRNSSRVKRILPKVEIKESKCNLTSHSGIYLVDQFAKAFGVHQEIDSKGGL